MRTPAQRLVGLVAGSVVLALAGAGPAGALPGGHATAGSTGTPQAAPVSLCCSSSTRSAFTS